LLPDVPTMAEAGVPTLNVNSTLFILAPAATPKTIVNALNSEIVKALSTEEVRDRLAGAGFEPKGGTAEDLGAFLKSDLARWGKVIKESGVRIE
jgi:tripartite-type tricarboxylate transporter receptor subunit TctC